MTPDSAYFHLQQQPSTLRLAVPNNFAFIMSKQCWCPIRDYFNRNGLELSDKKRALLVDWGCNSIESLKLLESDDWDSIFDSSYKKVKLQIAKKLFHHQLKEEEVNLSKWLCFIVTMPNLRKHNKQMSLSSAST